MRISCFEVVLSTKLSFRLTTFLDRRGHFIGAQSWWHYIGWWFFAWLCLSRIRILLENNMRRHVYTLWVSCEDPGCRKTLVRKTSLNFETRTITSMRVRPIRQYKWFHKRDVTDLHTSVRTHCRTILQVLNVISNDSLTSWRSLTNSDKAVCIWTKS